MDSAFETQADLEDHQLKVRGYRSIINSSRLPITALLLVAACCWLLLVVAVRRIGQCLLGGWEGSGKTLREATDVARILIAPLIFHFHALWYGHSQLMQFVVSSHVG